MIVLGLLLMLACVGLAADAVIENSSVISATIADRGITDLTLGTVFVAGAVLGLLFTLGLAMVIAGIGRGARKRRERAELRERSELATADRDAYPAETTTTTAATAGRHRAAR
jgi:predicted phage tail protein